MGETRIFPKNRFPSLFYIYAPLSSCKISEKTNEPIPRKMGYERTDGLTDEHEFIGHFSASGCPIKKERKEMG